MAGKLSEYLRRMFMQLGPVRYKYSAKERAENITITEALSLVARD